MGNEKVMEERRALVERIIENMKNGYVLPKPNWDRSSFAIHNPVSHAKYRGANLVRLYIAALDHGYKDGRWVTFKQAKSMGWNVKKGEKGVCLEKYIFEKVVEKENPDTGEMEKVKVRLDKPIVNTFVVFNASQIDGIPELTQEKKLEHDEILQIAEDFIASSECPIVETNEGRAYYSPKNDRIVLPFRDAFLDQTSFLATQLHEMVHSTGHPERLNRSLMNVFGSSGYAKEELRAELGAFFIQTDLGITLDAQHFNSHTEYLESWIQALENDPNELFRAMNDAQKAATYLEERYERYLENIKAKDELENDTPVQAPFIKCEWSESFAFEEGKDYSVEEFDRVMKQADTEWVEKRKQEIETYGDDFEAVWEAYERGDIDGVHLGYEKVKYTIFMPDGTSFPARQDIGEGDGGVISFLRNIGQVELAKELERVVATKGVLAETKDDKIAACKKSLQELAGIMYKEKHLPPSSMHVLVRQYGVDVMDRILASSLVKLEDDRVSSTNMAWAKVYCENKGYDREAALLTEDGFVLNQITNQLRVYEQQLDDNVVDHHFSPQDMLGVYSRRSANMFRAETEKKYIPVAGETYKEVENLASEHILSRLQEEGLDIFVTDVILTGSRSRGIATENSDLDFVVAYEGDIREDDLFSLLNAGDFAIEGIQVDFNPIRNEDIPEYLISAEEYLNKKVCGVVKQSEEKREKGMNMGKYIYTEKAEKKAKDLGVEEVKEFVSTFKETQNKSAFKAASVKKARCSR